METALPSGGQFSAAVDTGSATGGSEPAAMVDKTSMNPREDLCSRAIRAQRPQLSGHAMQFPQLLALPPDNVTTYEMCSGPSPDRDGARCGCYAQVTGQRLCDPRRGL